LGKLITVIAEHYQIKIEKLTSILRGKIGRCRSIAIYLAVETTGQPLRVISDAFMNVSYSTISRIHNKIKTQLEYDKNLQTEIKKIKSILLP
jgi:chromosomal replication initiation ATPase DnaA